MQSCMCDYTALRQKPDWSLLENADCIASAEYFTKQFSNT